MTNQEKQRLAELDAKADYLLARQDAQDAQMNQVIARLVYLEDRIYRLMKELDIDPDLVDAFQMVQHDARAINLTYLPLQSLN